MVGLFSLLSSYAMLLGQISLLGLPGVTARLFPRFRDKDSGHHGFLSIGLIFFTVGFILFLALFIPFSSFLINSNNEKSQLFADYLYLLVPLTFFSMLFISLDIYNKLLYDAVPGIFLQEFFQRALLFIAVVLFALGWINLPQLILAFTLALCMKAIVLFLLLAGRGELRLTIDRTFLTSALRKEILDVALFSIVTGLGSMVVFNIDKIVVNQMLDLSNTGVYTIAFYFGSLVVIPSRPLLKIAGTLIADAWSRNDIQTVKEIYYKSCINQFVIGGFLFLGVWANIDNILFILGDDYSESKWVIFFIGLGYLFDMLTGANALVIGYSKYYRVALVFILILIAIVITLLYMLIPIWGITGAAIAIAVALMLNNFMRFLFLFKKFRFQPFSVNFLVVAVFYLSLFFILKTIPQLKTFLDIVVRGSLITLATTLFLILVPGFDDSRNVIMKSLTKILNWTKSLFQESIKPD
ncbi:MAG: lipopolysaccharide biosynthesis protein [Mangrovibacterium sp.]